MKKAQLSNLFNIVISLVGIAIVLAMGFLIMAEGKSEIATNEGLNSTGHNSTGQQPSEMWNATGEVQGAIDDIPQWLPIFIIVAIGVILIGLVQLFRPKW